MLCWVSGAPQLGMSLFGMQRMNSDVEEVPYDAQPHTLPPHDAP